MFIFLKTSGILRFIQKISRLVRWFIREKYLLHSHDDWLWALKPSRRELISDLILWLPHAHCDMHTCTLSFSSFSFLFLTPPPWPLGWCYQRTTTLFPIPCPLYTLCWWNSTTQHSLLIRKKYGSLVWLNNSIL